MKKYLVIMMFAIAAFGFTGCSNDDFKSNVNWQNDTTITDVKNIQWVSISNSPNQTWNETVTQSGGISSTKEVSLETGKGLCFDDTTGLTEYEIEINGAASSYILTDGKTETLHITDLTAK